ncbi:MarR family winged helix-turn-helix transcriptional regulator [Mogibacterium sp.]|uniref:MarR family winged helix-turn-helix transcriptional regulator n=1 Tax=Mogibacterium sp. TaxID=2049035 RepID=UPI00257A9514|nr:MarR family transcriptional regulator [Mogibacterium sp.]MBN2934890.1 MarR family transcriptional regulator [Mogibacterium sp.]
MDDCKCNRNEIGMLIKQISFQMRTHADTDLRECDLTWSQAHLLRHLAKAGGQMSQKQIEKELEISHPTVVGLVQRLETKGFVESFTDEKDRRIKMVRLTEQAREHQHFMEERFREKEKLMTRGMSEEEVKELIRLLRELHANLEESKEGNDI